MESDLAGLHNEEPIMRDAGWVARLTGMRKKQVYEMARQGKIPGAHKYGKLVRFNEDKVRAWHESCAIAPEPALAEPPRLISVPSDRDDNDLKVEAVMRCG